MELTFEKTTHIGMGYATQADAFQCGREAAQMAKGQVPARSNDLILVFGPCGVRFKDFIEGVRLVTGDDKLVGVPVDWVASNDLPSTEACVVIVLQLSSVHFTIVSSGEQTHQLDSIVTSVLTQFREIRGTTAKMFDFRGSLYFENCSRTEKTGVGQKLASDSGLESWILGISPYGCEEKPMVFQNQNVRHGIIGIECFSNSPFGVGCVNVGAFANQIDIYKEAIKSSLRDASVQLRDQKPALGIVLINAPQENITRNEIAEVFRSAASSFSNIPVIAIPTRNQFSRCLNRSTTVQFGTVTSLLVPH